MSTTITQTVQRQEKVFEKRSTFIRSASIEKLKKFNNFVCSQHYFLLPGMLLWLKTSQTLLRSNMDKIMTYLKTMSMICGLRMLIHEKLTQIFVYKNDLTDVLKTKSEQLKFNLRIQTIHAIEQFKKFLLILFVYLSLFLIFIHTVGCAVFIFLNLPPIGFFFLIGCVLLIARIKFKILDQIENKTVKNVHVKLNLGAKTISKVKLF